MYPTFPVVLFSPTVSYSRSQPILKKGAMGQFYTTLPRTSNPTVGSHRILSENCRILSDPTGIHRKLLDSSGQNSDGKLSDVGKCRNISESDRNPDTPALSDIRQLPIGILSQGFCRNSLDPIGSYWVHSSWVLSKEQMLFLNAKNTIVDSFLAFQYPIGINNLIVSKLLIKPYLQYFFLYK